MEYDKLVNVSKAMVDASGTKIKLQKGPEGEEDKMFEHFDKNFANNQNSIQSA